MPPQATNGAAQNFLILGFVGTSINYLIRVVTLHAAVVASGSLTYLMGCGVAAYYSNQVCHL